MVIRALFLVGGLALILWGAERFTDGAIRTATRFALSPFFVDCGLYFAVDLAYMWQ